jgi:hypothetical protein
MLSCFQIKSYIPVFPPTDKKGGYLSKTGCILLNCCIIKREEFEIMPRFEGIESLSQPGAI